jgi:hypothetical protein
VTEGFELPGELEGSARNQVEQISEGSLGEHRLKIQLFAALISNLYGTFLNVYILLHFQKLSK